MRGLRLEKTQALGFRLALPFLGCFTWARRAQVSHLQIRMGSQSFFVGLREGMLR